MKFTYLIIFCSLLCLSYISLKNDCSDFKEGTFIYFDTEQNIFNKSFMAIRTHDKQIYIDSNKGDTLVYDLKWISDCSYTLIYTYTNKDQEGFLKLGDTLTVTIEPIDNSIFKYTSRIKKNDFKKEFKGRMIKTN